MQNAIKSEIDKVTLRVIVTLNIVWWILFAAVLILRWHGLHFYGRFYAILVLAVFAALWNRMLREHVSESTLSWLSAALIAVFLLFAEGH